MIGSLQKIIVLCLLIVALGLGFYFGSQSNNRDETPNNSEQTETQDQPSPDTSTESDDTDITSTKTKTNTETSPKSKTGEDTLCVREQRNISCPKTYKPVCGLVEVDCVVAPCYPVKDTFNNSCEACSFNRVISYTEGACQL